MKKKFLYVELADNISEKIKAAVFKPGDKLPSIRSLSLENGISINTAKRIYLELESLSLVHAKAQSGYYVSPQNPHKLPLPESSRPLAIAEHIEPNEIIDKVYSSMGRKDLTLFSFGVPAGNLLPIAKLKKEIVLATRTLGEGGTTYESIAGNSKLRRMIAARSLGWGGNLNENDLITTHGCMHAIALCLMALTKPGYTIGLESPCYPGILQLALSLGLKVLEISTHPETGIDLEALKNVIPKIDICLLVPNYNTPIGYCMPDANKKEVVSLLSTHHIPLIEDDTYGDLHFGEVRPKCCKSFDLDGNVLWCSSISKTLAPGYRVGWISPGKYKEQILKLKLVHTLSSSTIIHEAVGNFLMSGRYDQHLRKLRKTLKENYHNYVQIIANDFPEGTKVSRPQGGLTLWIEFPKQMDTIKLYNYAMKNSISIAPGRMFSLQHQYQHCMRLCFALSWDKEISLHLKHLGKLAKTLL
ncbi:PLP-dependent aminotransferase family protein [Sphingobacterium sp. HJSM2_6]|uniref:aminotransferase-like domain-containing protein n=1 Tax=Sphingobacterium sp. HJSM2_6 TaxID=3366264 RepID=UPI003BE15CE7